MCEKSQLIELEKLIKEEAKSRNRAEKKLKILMKKLKSMNISYISDGSEHSGLEGKSDISSVTSTDSSSKDEDMQNQKMKMSSVCGSEESEENAKSQKYPQHLHQIAGSSSSEMGPNEDQISPEISDDLGENVAQNSSFEDTLSFVGDANSEKSSQIESNQSYNDSKMDQQSDTGYGSVNSSNEERFSQENDQDLENNVDNSMALVPVDTPQKIQPVDPEVLDATVKEVLDALRHAKEQLQSSMERRRANMIRVG
ncbi:hypothetical protein BUALT_Bualt11G0114900 [Buddleja alternifolia]|uniref:Uncharacterized protein n=1 Tax=Buddleja alternifolia TaxID=168488 RepID=A0AAV6WVA4_9LAMI|nr:hypothetical protein BUALT_Bualt11G0114900 [Buddleja alternifolia]